MRILVADDEPLARRHLCRLLQETMPEAQVVAQTATGKQTLAAVDHHRPDLLLLDIDMPDGDGIAVATALLDMSLPPAIVFVTALADRAMSALQAGAVGYLVKPVPKTQLGEALSRATRVSRAQLQPIAEIAPPQHLAARVGRELRLIPISEIWYCRARDKLTLVSYLGGEVALETSLVALERQYPECFVRLRRDLIINRVAFRKLVRGDNGLVVELSNGERLPIARRHRRDFIASLERRTRK